MKTFLFYEKNSSCVLTMSADNFEEAVEELELTVIAPDGWRCDNPEGEDE